MFTKFRRSFELLSTSWQLLMGNKSLLAFPVMSIVVLVAVIGTFMLKIFPRSSVKSLRAVLEDSSSHYGWIFIIYLACYCVVNFFNTAFMSVVLKRMAGRRASISDGLRFALSRWFDLLVYSMIAATIGTVMEMLEKRLEYIGSMVAGLIGVTWSVASYLAIPALVAEGVGPLAATRRSVQLIQKCWGEGLIGNASIALICQFAALIVGIVALLAGHLTQNFLGGLIAAMLGCYILHAVSAAMEAIYLASLYRYATKGDARPFADEAMTGAFVST